MAEENDKLNWLIEQFVAGELPDDLHRQLRARLDTDPAFESHVLAHWMLRTYVQDQRHTAAFYQQIDAMAAEVGRRQRRNHPIKPFFLVQLVGLAAAVLVCVWVGTRIYRFSQPPMSQASTIAVTGDVENYGYAARMDSVIIVQYNRRVGFWDRNDSYTWRGKTLSIYSSELAALSTKTWQITPTERQNTYQLRTQHHTYQLHQNQLTPAPLYAENSTP